MSILEWILVWYLATGVVFTVRAMIKGTLEAREWWFIPVGILCWFPVLVGTSIYLMRGGE